MTPLADPILWLLVAVCLGILAGDYWQQGHCTMGDLLILAAFVIGAALFILLMPATP